MNKINWHVRFNKENKLFILRTAASILVPILAYLGLNVTDLTSWPAVGQLLLDFFTNPYLIGLTVFNILNVIPDPTTPGIADSPRALTYDEPGKEDYHAR